MAPNLSPTQVCRQGIVAMNLISELPFPSLPTKIDSSSPCPVSAWTREKQVPRLRMIFRFVKNHASPE
jgi:hypothetical protein